MSFIYLCLLTIQLVFLKGFALIENHWSAVKKILRYLKATLPFILFFKKSTQLSLHAFSDAVWAGNRDYRTSMIAYTVFLSANPISWSSKKQKFVSLS